VAESAGLEGKEALLKVLYQPTANLNTCNVCFVKRIKLIEVASVLEGHEGIEDYA